MARTISEIQRSMTERMAAERQGLSASGTAEWRLWTYIMAAAVHTFEVILDAFRKEVDAAADKITPGTVRWYVEQVRRFQNGHEIMFDEQTAQLYYAESDPESQIISVVAVTENKGQLSIKVAKLDMFNHITPLSSEERYNFTGYIDSIKFAGIETKVVSTEADRIRYRLEVFYDPAVPRSTVEKSIRDSLDRFRTTLDFNSMFYRQRFTEAVTAAHGVVTADLISLERQGISMTGFEPVAVIEELESGYFDYTDDCILNLHSIKTNDDENGQG